MEREGLLFKRDLYLIFFVDYQTYNQILKFQADHKNFEKVSTVLK